MIDGALPTDDDQQATPDGVVLAQITVTRILRGDDVVDTVVAEALDDTDMGLADALGMMRLAEDTLIRSYTDQD